MLRSALFRPKLICLSIAVSVLVYAYFPSDLSVISIDRKMEGTAPEKAENIYQFTVRDLDGNPVSLDKYRGKVLIIVNTAANCGLTKGNIKELNELYDKYKDKDFQILGFPSNDFKQELNCEQDIKMFVERNKIEFDYFGKIHVNGDETEPLYKYLKAKQGGFIMNAIKWNFTKFLVNKEGIPVKRYAPTTSPKDIAKDIEDILN